MPVITWRGGQIVVDLIDGFAPPAVLRLLAWLSTLLITTSFYFVALRIYELGARDLKRGITTDFLHLPAGLFIQAIAILSWITALGLLVCTFANRDRKSTRLNSSHVAISYAVFCLKKKN